MKNILVALDLDRELGPLLDYAQQLAQKFNAKTWLLYVADPEPSFVGYDIGPQYIRNARAKELKEEHRYLQALSKKLKEKGLDADGLLIEGPTAEAIVEEAERLRADLVIIGSHDHSLLYNILVGNTASSVLKRSKVPLLTIPLD